MVPMEGSHFSTLPNIPPDKGAGNFPPHLTRRDAEGCGGVGRRRMRTGGKGEGNESYNEKNECEKDMK